MNRIKGRLTTIANNLSLVAKDPERKGMARMCWEFANCSLKTRSVAVHYLTSFLYRRSAGNVLDYVSKREAKEIQDAVNDPRVGDLVSNKLFFTEHFERGGFPVPQLLGYNILDRLYLRSGDVWWVGDLSQTGSLANYLEKLFSERNLKELFIKPLRGSQGIGARKITLSDLSTERNVTEIQSSIAKESCVFQEVVAQHPKLTELNPCALNTMRIDTFRAPGEPAEILSAFLRVGGAGNCVDNVSAGGVMVGIHLDTGKLKDTAVNFFHGSRTFGTFKTNPLNGRPFGGYQVPLFEQVKETVAKAAAWIPPSLIGWDVAVSPSGPVLVEGNVLYYGLTSSDIAYGGYKKNPVYQKVLAYAALK